MKHCGKKKKDKETSKMKHCAKKKKDKETYLSSTLIISLRYCILFLTVYRFRRVTFVLLNRVKHKKLNQPMVELSFG